MLSCEGAICGFLFFQKEESMNIHQWLAFAAVVCIMIFVTGACLLLVQHVLKKQRMYEIRSNIAPSLMEKTKKKLVETTIECMDILPEKILEAKKTIEGE